MARGRLGLGLLVLACWAAIGSHSFLFHPGRPTSTATTTSMAGGRPQIVAAAAAAASDGDEAGDGAAMSSSSSSSTTNVATSQPRPKGNTTLLNDLKPGQKLHGGVVGVTDFAAFLDVQVVRKGAGGRLVRCNAMLHPHDVPAGVKLLRDGHPLPLEADPSVIRRGEHVQVFVKDVFPNSGRFSVTLDPTVNKAKVVRSRQQKRAQGKKRNKIEPIEEAAEGTEYEAQVVKVLRRGLLLDVGLPVPAFLAHSAIPEAVPLEEVCRVGRRMAVKVSEKSDKQIKCELLKLV